MVKPAMTDYYQARAKEYERVYEKPERQIELQKLKTWLQRETQERTILEVACGTGYWTAVAAPGAKFVLATDVNSGPLEIARAKNLGEHIEFLKANAYALPETRRRFDTCMAHFWWSHVEIANQSKFLTHLASRLTAGGRLLMIDNRYVEGSSTPVSHTDDDGNSYQHRRLANGAAYEVLKNFPSREDLERSLGAIATSISVTELKYYWAVSADLR